MADNSSRSRGSRRSRRRPLHFSTVIGELLIVAGLATLGYIIWQPWHTTVVVQGEQRERSASISAEWDQDAVEPEFTGTVPVVAQHDDSENFAILHVPSFSTEFANVMSEGTNPWSTLNLDEKGIGRYTTTQHLGEVGNTAFAAHRSGAHTAPFRELDALRVGDPMFVETPDGWYTYRYRSSEYVFPDETDVLFPFPRIEGGASEERILTLTTCHPKNLGISERLISYSVFESFSTRADGPPQELIDLNPNLRPEGG